MKKVFFLFVFSWVVSLPAFAGFSLGQTRVIYNADEDQSTLRVINDGKSDYYLVQAWITDGEGSKGSENDFIITPPVFKVYPESENTILIKSLSDGFPDDRESLFYLNVKAIPAVDSTLKNKVTFATKNIIKLIYRPKSLNLEGAYNAWKNLTVTQGDGAVIFKNPTPYIINTGVLYINGHSEELSYILPFSEKRVVMKTTERASTVEFNVINDFGGASKLHKFKL